MVNSSKWPEWPSKKLHEKPMRAALQKMIPHRDITSGLLLVGLSLWVYWQTTGFPQLDDGYPGPSLFPGVIALCIGTAGVVMILKRVLRRSTRARQGSSGIQPAALLRLLAGITLAALYPLLVQFTHFIPLMAFIILFVGLLLKNEAWHALLLSVLSASLIYALFTQLLKVPL